MAEEWSQLADDFQDDPNIIIGKMDCTKPANKVLCRDEFNIKGYPTLLYGDVTQLEQYKGPRELEEFRTVVKEYLQHPLCGVQNPHLCQSTKRQQIEDFTVMGISKLEQEIQKMEDLLAMNEKMHTDTVADLKKTYQVELKQKNQKKLQFEKDPVMKLLKNMLKSKEKAEKQEKEQNDEL